MGDSNASPNGDPLADPPAPPPDSQIQFYPTTPPPVFRVRVGEYEAQAPTAREVCDLLWVIRGSACPETGADEGWKAKYVALRDGVVVLMAEIDTLDKCFSCDVNAGHFHDCPVQTLRELLPDYADEAKRIRERREE